MGELGQGTAHRRALLIEIVIRLFVVGLAHTRRGGCAEAAFECV